MPGREDQRRGVIDTSVLVAGIAGFKSGRPPLNPSAVLLRDWLERATFIWLITEDILAEYKEVLRRLGVRRNPARSLRLLTGRTFLRRGSWLKSFRRVIQSPRREEHYGLQSD